MPGTRRNGSHRRRDERGQALVEFALVLPLVILLVGVAFNGWNGIQLSLRLTSAARAGAIQAANDFANDLTDPTLNPADLAPNSTYFASAWTDAKNAVNQEENTNIYQNSSSSNPYYVNMTETTQNVPADVNSPSSTIYIVTITISRASITLVPVVGNFAVSAQADARYS
jgi:Flp pilus assembly protein TadG